MSIPKFHLPLLLEYLGTRNCLIEIDLSGTDIEFKLQSNYNGENYYPINFELKDVKGIPVFKIFENEKSGSENYEIDFPYGKRKKESVSIYYAKNIGNILEIILIRETPKTIYLRSDFDFIVHNILADGRILKIEAQEIADPKEFL